MFTPVPRNYAFFKRLPETFRITVLEEGNSIESGTWYYVEINGHNLNLLSQTKLIVGDSFLVRKEHTLKLVRV